MLVALAAGWLLWTHYAHRPRAITVSRVSVESARHAWSVNSGQGRIAGFIDTLSVRSRSDQSPRPLLDLAIDPVSSRLLAADPTGRLRGLAEAGSETTARFAGLITGVKPLDDGRLVFCLGHSGFGADYFILLVDPKNPGVGESVLPTNFCTTLLASNGRDIYYATKHARLAQVSPEGTERWKVVLAQPPMALGVARDGRVAAGDDRGDLTMISATGQVQRAFRASEFPLTAVAFLGEEAVLATDANGEGRVFTTAGRELARFTFGAAAGRIRAIVPVQRELYLATDGGSVLGVHGLDPLPAAEDPRLARWRYAGMAILAGVGGLLAMSASRRVQGFGERAWRARAAYALVLPTFGLLALFCYYPMVTALGYSFVKFSLTSPWEFVGLDNFRAMVSDPYLAKSVINMIILLVTGLVKMIVMPLLAAELIFWLPWERWQQFFRSAMIFPAVLPGVVMVLVWKMIYDPYSGLINVTLRALGLSDKAHAWLGDGDLALWSVVFYNFPWINLLIFLIFLGGLIQIDRSLFEASDMDGASVWQRFRYVDLPALKPKLTLAVTLIFIWSVQDFASVLILTGGGPGMATYVPALQMFEQISDGHNLGYTSAIGFVLFLVVVTFTFFNLRFNREQDA